MGIVKCAGRHRLESMVPQDLVPRCSRRRRCSPGRRFAARARTGPFSTSWWRASPRKDFVTLNNVLSWCPDFHSVPLIRSFNFVCSALLLLFRQCAHGSPTGMRCSAHTKAEGLVRTYSESGDFFGELALLCARSAGKWCLLYLVKCHCVS